MRLSCVEQMHDMNEKMPLANFISIRDVQKYFFANGPQKAVQNS